MNHKPKLSPSSKSKGAFSRFRNYNRNMGESGQGLTEYIVLLILIAVVSIGTTKTLGSRIKAKIKNAGEKIHSEVSVNGD